MSSCKPVKFAKMGVSAQGASCDCDRSDSFIYQCRALLVACTSSTALILLHLSSHENHHLVAGESGSLTEAPDRIRW